MISIVVPVYNAQEYLGECVRSVINQTSAEWELILVDDGSTDDSRRICNDFARNYPQKVKVFHHENRGQFFSRTFGIKKCIGDYIGFLDADDFLDEKYVEKLEKSIRDAGSPDLVCFSFCRWNGKITKIYQISCKGECQVFRGNEMKEVYEQFIEGSISGSMCSKVFKASVILGNLPKSEEAENRRSGEDSFQSFSVIGNVKSIILMKECLYFYRENPAGTSLGYGYRDMDYFNTKYVFEVLLKNLKKWDMDDENHNRKLLAYNFNKTVYTLLEFFRSAPTLKRKFDVINFNWSSYLLKPFDDSFEKNPYLRHSYVRVWKAFYNKKYITIFLKEKLRRVVGW